MLTKLNNYGIEVMIIESEIQKEVLCPAWPDSMLLEPFTMLSSEELKRVKSSMTRETGRTSLNDWGILPKRRKPRSMPGPKGEKGDVGSKTT